mgnify:CR=1 FL=1
MHGCHLRVYDSYHNNKWANCMTYDATLFPTTLIAALTDCPRQQVNEVDRRSQ